MLCKYIINRFFRTQNLKKELEALKLQFLNGDIEKWNTDLGIEEQTDLLPYDTQWEFPRNKLKLGNIINYNANTKVQK